MEWKVPTLARVANHWSMNTDTMGVYGNYYLKRAIVAQLGLGANLPEDAIYPLNLGDEAGKPLDGANKYTLHFEKGATPPVNAFWSVTLYDPEGFQVANSLNRFAVSSWMPFKYNADGSLDLYFQNESPGKDKEANWLPAPKGAFNLTMRLYGPKSEALTGKWNPPPVTRVQGLTTAHGAMRVAFIASRRTFGAIVTGRRLPAQFGQPKLRKAMSVTKTLPRPTRVVRCRDGGERTQRQQRQRNNSSRGRNSNSSSNNSRRRNSNSSKAAAATAQKPNILFIMGDDIGWMQPSIYHRGLMVGETPNIDRIGNEGAIFMHYYAEQSCTAGRNAFFTGMHPLRTGMIPPQLPGSPSYLRPGTPALAQVPARSRLQHRRVRQEPPGRPHRRAADGARLPGILGLPVSPRRDAGGELPRHQQDPDPADHRAAVQEHADPRPPRGPRRRRSRRPRSA